MCTPRKDLLILQLMRLFPAGAQPICHTSHDQHQLLHLEDMQHSVVLSPCAAAH